MMDSDTSIDEAVPDPDLGGGSGGRPARADLAALKLFRRALAQGWPIPGPAKALAVRRMTEILENDEAGARSHVAAVRTLLGMTTATTAAIQAAVLVHEK